MFCASSSYYPKSDSTVGPFGVNFSDGCDWYYGNEERCGYFWAFCDCCVFCFILIL